MSFEQTGLIYDIYSPVISLMEFYINIFLSFSHHWYHFPSMLPPPPHLLHHYYPLPIPIPFFYLPFLNLQPKIVEENLTYAELDLVKPIPEPKASCSGTVYAQILFGEQQLWEKHKHINTTNNCALCIKYCLFIVCIILYSHGLWEAKPVISQNYNKIVHMVLYKFWYNFLL